MSTELTVGGARAPDRIGRYAITQLLGIGGFAEVYRALDETLDAEVAVKLLDRAAADDQVVRDRFVAEARLLRRVDDSHVVTVYDIGEHVDGRPYFVMEFANGGPLSARVPADGLQDPRCIAQIVRDLASGLEALHTAGIVHRDIKPENLLLVGPSRDSSETRLGSRAIDEGERVVVGDLGIAKDRANEHSGPTILAGSPAFQAPEQAISGAGITSATDVFGATGVLWNVLTGDDPPAAATLPVEVHRLPEVWRPLMLQGLAEDPRDRFATIGAWASSCLELLGEGDGPIPVTAGGAETHPYKGLAAFQPDDAALFFGRERLVDELVGRLQTSPALVVGGPSGSGKSSLVRAGLVPHLHSGALPGSPTWRTTVFTPGADALGELSFHVRRLADAPELTSDVLRTRPEDARRSLSLVGPVVLVIDQFEELFTQNEPDVQAAVIDALEALTLGQHNTTRVIIVVRADFYATCARYPWLADRINENQVLVGPMNNAELRRAIEGPAARVGLRLEAGLVDQILDDAGHEEGSLPLVAHALMETWLRRHDGEMTVAGYGAAGGVTGAISQRAEETYNALAAAERPLARELVLQMTSAGELGPDTRRLVRWDELAERRRVQPIVDTFVDARLVTTTDDHIEIAHETLLHSWPRAAQWIDEARDDLRTRQRLSAAAEQWLGADRDADLLLRGTPLESALDWVGTTAAPLTPAATEFLTASREDRNRREAEAHAEIRRRKRTRRFAIGALVVLAAAAVLQSVNASRNARTAREQVDVALAATAEANASTDPLFAIALAAESAARRDEPLPESVDALATARAALTAQSPAPLPLSDLIPVGDVLHLDLSDDGSLLVLAGRDGDVTFWDVESRSVIQSVRAHTKGIEAVHLDEDGRRLVTGAADGKILLWDLTQEPYTFEELDTIAGLSVWNVDISPDGRTVAAITNDAGVTIYDLEARTKRFDRFESATSRDALRLVFVDNDRLFIGNSKGEVIVVDTDAGAPVGVLMPHETNIWEFDRSPDGSFVYTASNDGTIRRVDVRAGAVDESFLLGMAGDVVPLLGLEALPDGRHLVTGTESGHVQLWDVTTGALLATTGAQHRDRVIDADSTADGELYVTLGDDQNIRLWSISERQRGIAEEVVEAGVGLRGLAWRADGGIAAGTAEGTVLLITDDGEREIAVGDGPVFGLAFLPDGTLVAGDDNGRVSFVDVATGAVLAADESTNTSRIMDIEVRPNGDEILVGAADGSLTLYETTGDFTSRRLATVSTGLNKLAFVSNDEIVAVGLADRLEFVDLDGQTSRPPVETDEEGLFGVTVDREGGRIAVAGGRESVVVYELGALEQVARVTPLANGARDVAFLDEHVVVGVSASGVVGMWRIDTGDQLGPLSRLATGALQRLTVDAHRGVWATGDDGVLYRYDVLDPDTSCELTDSVLDEQRRIDFLGGDELAACPG